MMEIIYLTWLNNLGGFEYWPFISKYDELVDVEASQTTNKNIFPAWPKSYGPDADTIQKQTFRRSRKSLVIKSQNLTKTQVRDLSAIRRSILVQVLTTAQSRQTVIVDSDSFTVFRGMDKMHTLTFKISYTSNLPVQHA